MKILIAGMAALSTLQISYAQNNASFSEKETSRILNYLASDEMRGRKTFSPDIDKAADFIAAEFKNAGLQPLKDNNYLQAFFMNAAKVSELNATINNQPFGKENVIIIAKDPEINVTEKSGYTISKISKGDNIFKAASTAAEGDKNTIVLVDSGFGEMFSRLNYFNQNYFNRKANTIFVFDNPDLSSFSIKAKIDIEQKKLSNVVGVLPGKSKKDEYVIFSAHYDHLGVDTPNAQGDSIYNGANDDASGTTAVIELAKYFKKQNNNERTLIFATFTAEEIGGFGSKYFSQQLPSDKIAAMFNIEMIGTDSKWGKNSAYITGFDKSNMGEILQKNLKNSGFNFYPDPYTTQNLFYRSDNATLARLGVPAHTISTSKMDAEPNYHQLSDEVKTLDLDNMTEIIKSIAVSSASIVAGKDTPSRVATENLK